MSLDHGTLNLPLAKRGNIDAQIDAHKRAQRRDHDTARDAHRKATKALHDRLSNVPDEKLASLAGKLGISITRLRIDLRSRLARRDALTLRYLEEVTA